MTSVPNEPLNDVELEVVRASEITPKEVKWLWYPYIPFGKVTLFAGRSRRRKKQIDADAFRAFIAGETASVCG